MVAEKGSGAGSFRGGDVFRSALGDDFTARFSAFGTEIDQVVRLGQDIQMVLNHHHGVTGFHQAMEKVNQTAHIGEMESDGGFFQKKEVMGRTTSATLGLGLIGGDLSGGQFRDQF